SSAMVLRLVFADSRIRLPAKMNSYHQVPPRLYTAISLSSFFRLPRPSLRPPALGLPRFAGFREMLRTMQLQGASSALFAHCSGCLGERVGLFGSHPFHYISKRL